MWERKYKEVINPAVGIIIGVFGGILFGIYIVLQIIKIRGDKKCLTSACV